MQRPQTIVWWEILFWIAIIIGIINLFVFTPSVDDMMNMTEMEQTTATAPATTAPATTGDTAAAPATAPTAEEMAMVEKAVGWGEIIVAIVYVLLGLLFWYFIARKGNNVFKWIWVVLAVLGILGSLANLGATFAFSVIGGILALIVLVIGIVNIVLLFLPASKPWFDHSARTATPTT